MGERVYGEEELFAEISPVMNENTHRSRGRLFVANARRNEEGVRGRGAIPRDFGGFDVCIVGAGESLWEGVDYMRINRGSIKVFVVDMALRAVMKAGIVPDFCFTLEPINSHWRFFDGLDTKDITLVAHCFGSTGQIAAWKGPVEYVRFPPEGNYWLDKMYKKAAFNKLPLFISAGNVSSFAFVWAYACKPRNIVFIGNDLGWKRMYYAQETAPHRRMVDTGTRLSPVDTQNQEMMRNEKRMRKELRVEADNIKFRTNAAFFMARKWIDDFITHHGIKNVFCASDMGITRCTKVKPARKK